MGGKSLPELRKRQFREQLWEKLREKLRGEVEKLRAENMGRNFGDELFGRNCGEKLLEKLWEELRGNYSQNQGKSEENRMGESCAFLKEFRKPLGHEVTRKFTGAGRVLAFLQRES